MPKSYRSGIHSSDPPGISFGEGWAMDQFETEGGTGYGMRTSNEERRHWPCCLINDRVSSVQWMKGKERTPYQRVH